MREREVQLLFYNVQPGKCTLITGGFNLFHIYIQGVPKKTKTIEITYC